MEDFVEKRGIGLLYGGRIAAPRIVYETVDAAVMLVNRAYGFPHAVKLRHIYWKPVFNILEDCVHVILANPHEVKARKGHKTDHKDGWWLAHLLRHAMITASFIPPRPQRELRDLTRRRKKIIQAATGEKNRVDKMLQDANVKLSDALSDIFGVSGQLMLESLLKGNPDPAAIAAFAKGKAKKRIPQIMASLEQHQMREHHRMMIRFSLEHLRFLEEQLSELDQQIGRKIEEAGYKQQYELLQTLPGVSDTASALGRWHSEHRFRFCHRRASCV
jgi:transposase